MNGIMIGTIFAVTLHLCGSSQLDDGKRDPKRWPYFSWGTEMEKYMPVGNNVRNLSRSGHSTKSYRDEGHWAKLIAEVKPGDFVGIQFGANDQKCNTDYYREKRWAAPDGLFKDIEREWIREIRAKGATPILISHSGRCTFNKEGTAIEDHESAPGVRLRNYAEASRQLAEELKCDFVDMQKHVRERSESLGKAEALKSYVISTGYINPKDGEPSKDTTHPIKTGAEAQAKMFMDDVRSRGLSVAKLFEKKTIRVKGDFNAAFAKAATTGGRIVVPRGKWKTKEFRFYNRCELVLEEGAVVECGGIQAAGCADVMITGTGKLRLVKDGKLDFSNCRAVRLRDFTVVGGVEPIQLGGATDVSVRKVTMEAYTGEPINAQDALDINVEKCKFDRFDEEKFRKSMTNPLVRDNVIGKVES